MKELPKTLILLFNHEEDQKRIVSLLHSKLERLSKAIVDKNLPTILETAQELKTELAMFGFDNLSQHVYSIHDEPLNEQNHRLFLAGYANWKHNFLD